MNFLQLAQRLQQEAGISGSVIAQVQNQVGDFDRVAFWIRTAWNEIQAERREWSFKWREYSQLLSAGDRDYDLIAELAASNADIRLGEGPWVVSGDFGRRRLGILDFKFFQNKYASATVSAGVPTEATFLPDQTFRFERELDRDLTLTGDYYVENQNLTANGDVPGMQEKYHLAILYRALRKYAGFDEATEIWRTANAEDMKWAGVMARDLLPKVLVGADALA